jgi:hypothetical protein
MLFIQVFTLLLLPNTKHLPLEVIHKRWAAHWLWKRVYNKQRSDGLNEPQQSNRSGFNATEGASRAFASSCLQEEVFSEGAAVAGAAAPVRPAAQQ